MLRPSQRGRASADPPDPAVPARWGQGLNLSEHSSVSSQLCKRVRGSRCHSSGPSPSSWRTRGDAHPASRAGMGARGLLCCTSIAASVCCSSSSSSSLPAGRSPSRYSIKAWTLARDSCSYPLSGRTEKSILFTNLMGPEH